jgi:hypothetical protein
MKNLKNTLVALGLAAVLGVGAATANAGIITSDSSVKETKGQCSVKNDGFFGQFADIINGLTGINIKGLIFSEAPCNTEKEKTGKGMVALGYRKA